MNNQITQFHSDSNSGEDPGSHVKLKINGFHHNSISSKASEVMWNSILTKYNRIPPAEGLQNACAIHTCAAPAFCQSIECKKLINQGMNSVYTCFETSWLASHASRYREDQQNRKLLI
ncbi:MAG: hypothetical protein SPK23_00310 [Eubacteriales bacterium]|nr:hypothetical protein [Clostridiales bacterium]MDY5835559.1 hypothetical protein [Eubacteriales bacterium]